MAALGDDGQRSADQDGWQLFTQQISWTEAELTVERVHPTNRTTRRADARLDCA
jgi:hypothetical protein